MHYTKFNERQYTAVFLYRLFLQCKLVYPELSQN